MTDINNLLIGGVVIEPPLTLKVDKDNLPSVQLIKIRNDEKEFPILFFYDMTQSLTVGQNIIVKGSISVRNTPNDKRIIIICRNYTTCHKSQNNGINEIQLTGEITNVSKPLNAQGLEAQKKDKIHMLTIMIQFQTKYKTESIPVTAFDKVAQNLKSHAIVGSKILIKGTLKNLNRYKGILLKEFAILAKPSDH